MDEPLIPVKPTSATKTRLPNLPKDEKIAITITPSLKNHIIYGEPKNQHSDFNFEPFQEPEVPIQPSPDESEHTVPFLSNRKTNLRRSKTAPAMAVIKDLITQVEKPQLESNSIVKQAVVLLFIYLSLGVIVFWFKRDDFSGNETNPIVDGLYFCIVTMCTIGYGDITPQTSFAKIYACLFVLVGFGFIDVLLTGMVTYVLDLQENLILGTVRVGKQANNLIVDVEKGRLRIRTKVGLALAVVILCNGIGTIFLHFVEKLNWIDSFYLSVMSVTTVGYGDRAFETMFGRLFASGWLLISTLAVARAFLFLAEAKINKRHRLIAKWILQRDMTVGDLLAADINNNGFVSKSEYVIYKLKEMGKIGEKDIAQIFKQFSKVDLNNSGKIRLLDLLNSR